MKKFLLSIAALVLSIGVNAQVNFVKADASFEKSPVATKMVASPLKAKALNNNQRVIGPYSGDEIAEYGLGLPNYPDTYPIGIFMTDGFSDYDGTTLTKIRFALCDKATINYVFFYTVNNEGMITEVASQDFTGNAVVGWNEVELSTPVTLDFSGVAAILMGYEYVQASGGYPLSVCDAGEAYPTYIYGNLGSSGEGWYNLGTEAYGSLSVQAIVESDNFAENAVAPKSFGTFSIASNSTKGVDVRFSNLGTSVNNISYTIAYDGVAGDEVTYTLPNPINSVGGSFTANIPFSSTDVTGDHDVTLTVTKVNGAENGSSSNEAYGKMIVVYKEVPRGLVVEEFTGTGCGWCPRGLVGMERLRNAYGNSFVGIGIHQYNGTDAMYTENYADLGFLGAPQCTMNRKSLLDPYYGSDADILDDAAVEMNDLPLVGVSVSGAWNEDESAVITTAQLDALKTGEFEIVYVMVADGLTGKSSGWRQTNYYSSAYSQSTGLSKNQLPSDLVFLWDAGSTYYPEFNDVLVSSSYEGTANKAGYVSLTEGSVTTDTYEIPMPTSNAVLNAIDKTKLAVCALVVDPETGIVLNAAKTYPFNPDEIRELNGNAAKDVYVVEQYNAAGQRVAAPQKGLNILKMSNGETRKVILD